MSSFVTRTTSLQTLVRTNSVHARAVAGTSLQNILLCLQHFLNLFPVLNTSTTSSYPFTKILMGSERKATLFINGQSFSLHTIGDCVLLRLQDHSVTRVWGKMRLQRTRWRPPSIKSKKKQRLATGWQAQRANRAQMHMASCKGKLNLRAHRPRVRTAIRVYWVTARALWYMHVSDLVFLGLHGCFVSVWTSQLLWLHNVTTSFSTAYWQFPQFSCQGCPSIVLHPCIILFSIVSLIHFLTWSPCFGQFRYEKEGSPHPPQKK